MFKYGPPGSQNWGWDEVNSAFQQGKLAMAMQWYYFDGSKNSDPKVNQFADSTGFGVLPGAVGRDDKFRRQTMVGGQSMALNTSSQKFRPSSSLWNGTSGRSNRNDTPKYARPA